MNETRLLFTLVVFAGVFLVGFLARRVVAELDLRPEQRQRTRVVIRYGLLLVLCVGLTTVWAEVVNQAALVASGFAVAIVLFNKDLILNVLGWWQKTISGAFRIGDRVRVGEFRGDVLDYGLLATTIMEVDPEATHGMRTGNVITMPNMLLLTQPVVNETLVLDFEWKEYRFEVPTSERSKAEHVLLEAANEILAPYRDDVEAALREMGEHYAFRPIEVAPRIFVEMKGLDELVLILRLATPARALRVTHDALTRAYLASR